MFEKSLGKNFANNYNGNYEKYENDLKSLYFIEGEMMSLEKSMDNDHRRYFDISRSSSRKDNMSSPNRVMKFQKVEHSKLNKNK